MRLHVANITGDDRGFKQVIKAQIAHLFVKARTTVATIGDSTKTHLPVPQPAERIEDVGEQDAAQEGPTEVPGFPQVCTLLRREMDIMPSSHAAAEVRVARINAIPMEGARSLLLHREANVAA